MSFISKIKNWIHRQFTKVPDEIKEITGMALKITTGIKHALEHPVADLLAAIIPGEWDDQTKQRAIDILARVIPHLLRIDECKEKDMPCIFRHLISVLRERAEKDQHATLIALAQLFVAAWDGNRMKESQYDFYTQMAYSAQK